MSRGRERTIAPPTRGLRGAVRVPGDKSISHRALLLNALSCGSARVRGMLDADDVRATARALRALGATVAGDAREAIVSGPGGGLREPEGVIDCGNSGTSMRVLLGVLAAEPLFAVLTGDASLRRRPMRRVVEPLRRMGARVDGRGDGSRAPLAVRGGELAHTAHDLRISSAQVKTALLLAGRHAGVQVREPRRSRDHTELLLRAMGAKLVEEPGGWLQLEGRTELQPVDVDVPGDLSSAAFWLVAGSLVPGSEIRLAGVGVNPTRSGVLDVLRAMGADIEVAPVQQLGAEPVADLIVRTAALRGTRIGGELALRSIDELPVLAVAAAFAEGETVLTDAAELRHKESDRLAHVAGGLRALGAEVEEAPDGLRIAGGGVRGGGRVQAGLDHRLAMAFAVAGLRAPDGVVVDGADAVRTSYPAFFDHLEALCR